MKKLSLEMLRLTSDEVLEKKSDEEDYWGVSKCLGMYLLRSDLR
jgi:hypothetical protein